MNFYCLIFYSLIFFQSIKYNLTVAVKKSSKSTITDCDDTDTLQECSNRGDKNENQGEDFKSTENLIWGGIKSTSNEISSILKLRNIISKSTILSTSSWLNNVHDIELLRFLRARNGNVEEAWKMITAHASWRISQYGADSIYTKTAFANSPLHHEIFWLGLDQASCPTLVIRTQVHDGIYYNEDPKVFTSFVISVLEEGRIKYGVGIERQMCILMDRGGIVWRNGKKKIEKLDMAVIPNLIELFRHLYNTILENYPDSLQYANIVPISFFFKMCYKITSTVMDSKSRAKFRMIKESDISKTLHNIILPSQLPEHLGGIGETYRSEIDILYEVNTDDDKNSNNDDKIPNNSNNIENNKNSKLKKKFFWQ